MDSGLKIISALFGSSALVIPSDAPGWMRVAGYMLHALIGNTVGVCDGANDEVELAAAYAVSTDLMCAKGTLHIGASLSVPANSRTAFNNIALSFDAAAAKISLNAANILIEGKITSITDTATAVGNGLFQLAAAALHTWFKAKIDSCTLSTCNSLFELYRCTDTHLVGGIVAHNTVKPLVQSSSWVADAYVENVYGTWDIDPVVAPVFIAGYVHNNVWVKHTRFDGGSVSNVVATIVLGGTIDSGYSSGMHIDDIKVTNFGCDPVDILHCKNVSIDNFDFENCGSVNGGGLNPYPCKDVRIGKGYINGDYYSGILLDPNWGSCRRITISEVLCVDNGRGAAGAPTARKQAGISFTGSTPYGAPDPGRAVDRCLINNGDDTFSNFTPEANNDTINDVLPLVGGLAYVHNNINFGETPGVRAGNFTGILVKYSTAANYVGTATWQYSADDGTRKNLPGIVDPTNGFRAAPGTYLIKWDLPYDWEKTQVLGGFAELWVHCNFALTGFTTGGKGDRMWLRHDIQDITIENCDTHSELATTQLYGIGMGAGVKRVKIIGNKLKGETAPVFIGVAADMVEDVNAHQNPGYVTENSGIPAIGTGGEQTIPHGLGFTPTRDQIALFAGSATALPYHSTNPDGVNIYVTAALNQPWYWATVGR